MNEAERLAEELENLEATGWGGDCFALTEHSEKQANLAAAELRRLSAINAELVSALENIAIETCDSWSNGAKAQAIAMAALKKAKQ